MYVYVKHPMSPGCVLYLIASCICIVYNVYMLVIGYLNEPTITTVSEGQRTLNVPIPFPSFTVCNMHLMNATNVRQIFHDFDSVFVTVGNEEVILSLADYIWTSYVNPDAILQLPEHVIQALESQYEKWWQTSDDHSLMQVLLGVGYSCVGIVKQCMFDGVAFDCCANSTTLFHPEYGKCHVIKPPTQHQSHMGVQGGLQVVLYSSQIQATRSSYNMTSFSHAFVTNQRLNPVQESGVYVSFGDPSQIHLFDNPLFIGQGNKVLARISATSFDYLSPLVSSFSHCSIKSKLQYLDAYYSVPLCHYEHTTITPLIHACSCLPPGIYNENIELQYPYCTPSQFRTCSKLVSPDNQTEPCKQLCNQWNYNAMTSWTKPPKNRPRGISREHWAQHIFHDIGLNLSENEYNFQFQMDYVDGESIEDNLIWLTVFFEDSSYVTFRECERETITSLISSVGGILGLYAGLSLLSILQFIEYSFRSLCDTIFHSKKHSKSRLYTVSPKETELQQRDKLMILTVH